MDVHLYIEHGNQVLEPVTEGSISWETKRKGEAGKCSFTLLSDANLEVEEGKAVRLDVNGQTVFFGFIFERSWNKEGQMQVTAYDQLRYLKNKDSYNYENKTASQVIQMIADDFHLNVGTLEDTGYVITSRNMKDKSLFDIILDALDLTLIYTGKLFVLYDDGGKLTLTGIEQMKLGVAIDGQTAEDYDFKISIDQDTYNQIKLYQDNETTKKRDVFLVRDTEKINRWGVLQLNESLDQGLGGQQAAEQYLARYSQPTKSLSIKNALGDVRVRAGCLIPVFLDVKDMQLKHYLLIEGVTHTIDQGVHWMDLTLRGAGING